MASLRDIAVVTCPRCKPWARVRRPDGTKIAGWVPEATYVGYLDAPRSIVGKYKRPPLDCPVCGTRLRRRVA